MSKPTLPFRPEVYASRASEKPPNRAGSPEPSIRRLGQTLGRIVPASFETDRSLERRGPVRSERVDVTMGDPRREPEPSRFGSTQMRAVRASTGTRDAASVSQTLEAAGAIQSVLVRATLQAARAMRTGDFETARTAFEELNRHRVISRASHDAIDSCVTWWIDGGADRV